jgi:hypothetical protein
LSDRIQQQGLQHADSYVGSCHLQRELFWDVKDIDSFDFQTY